MLQKHSFFSQPLIFFGSQQINEEEEEFDENAWQPEEPWFIANSTFDPASQVPNIGLFIHWTDAADKEYFS
jgi:hypothetical protein